MTDETTGGTGADVTPVPTPPADPTPAPPAPAIPPPAPPAPIVGSGEWTVAQEGLVGQIVYTPVSGGDRRVAKHGDTIHGSDFQARTVAWLVSMGKIVPAGSTPTPAPAPAPTPDPTPAPAPEPAPAPDPTPAPAPEPAPAPDPTPAPPASPEGA